jgi:hypothetical protein
LNTQKWTHIRIFSLLLELPHNSFLVYLSPDMNTFDKTLNEVKRSNKLWVLQILQIVQITLAVWQMLLMTSAGHLFFALHWFAFCT